MEALILDFIKVYGPLSLGWVGFGYMLVWTLRRYDAEIERRVKDVTVMEKLADVVEAREDLLREIAAALKAGRTG